MFNRIVHKYCSRSASRYFSTSKQPADSYKEKVSKSFKDAWKEEQDNNGRGLIFPALFTVGFIIYYSSAKDKQRRLANRAEEAEKESKNTKEALNEAKQTIRQKEAHLEQYKTNLRTEFETQSASIAKNLRVKENVLKQEITNVLDKVEKMDIAPIQEKTMDTTSDPKQ